MFERYSFMEKLGLTTFSGKSIMVFIDEFRTIENNNLDNLELLCPNCHAQTSTYRGKNIKKLSSVSPSS